jgi:hypothetical protein
MSTTPTPPNHPDAPRQPALRLALFVGLGLVVALGLAFFVSPEASSQPDGLNKVSIDEGFADRETAHATEDSPLAGYSVGNVESDRIGTGLAGIVGVAVTFALAGGGFLLLRRSQRHRTGPGHAPTPEAG